MRHYIKQLSLKVMLVIGCKFKTTCLENCSKPWRYVRSQEEKRNVRVVTDTDSEGGSPGQPIKFQPLASVEPSGQQPNNVCTQPTCTQGHATYIGAGACFSTCSRAARDAWTNTRGGRGHSSLQGKG